MLGMIRTVLGTSATAHGSCVVSMLRLQTHEHLDKLLLPPSACFISTEGVRAPDSSSGLTAGSVAELQALDDARSASTATSIADTQPQARTHAEEQVQAPLPAPKEDLVTQFLSGGNMSKKKRFHQERMELIKGFQRHAADTSSPEVTVAIWTQWIRERVKDFHRRPKQPHALRELEMTMHKRRRLLSHLRDVNFKAYTLCIHKLGLADVFGTSMCGDRYPVGKAHDDPAGAADHVRRRIFSFHTEYRQKKTSQWKRLLPQLQFQDPNLPTPPSRMIPGSVQRL